ncbi:MAG: flagellar hook-basal body complex protein [Halarcobacter sp.]
MIGALWTGISGLASHQAALDNESHNIANVNTIGYKASRISFADQMYQDRIGKGSKILDAEKLYVQGNLKLTGVNYDMALSGEGFFTVLNTRSSGSAETLFTRAGNFRMGDNGTLQDAAGNEVQGWAMRAIDSGSDVISTNPNTKMFTNDFTKLLTSKVVSHSNYIETITAKATDYSASAKADSSTIFEGAGGKTKSAKESDVEALVSNYSTWLQKLKDTPDGGSASSTAQISQVNFKSGNEALISKGGDQVYVNIGGNTISQNYTSVIADDAFKDNFELNSASIAMTGAGPFTATNTIDTFTLGTTYEMTVDDTTFKYTAKSPDASSADVATGLAAAGVAAGIAATASTNTVVVTGVSTSPAKERTYDSAIIQDFDIAASRIATYKGLADKLSQIPGLRAYMADESDITATSGNDVLQENETFKLSTKTKDMLKGIIQIESLIPGETFTITEIGENSGNNNVAGSFQTSTSAIVGTGVGALQSARDALSEAISGKQQDVYTPSDLGFDGTTPFDFLYGMTIYDKELDRVIPVPGDNSSTPAIPLSIFMDGVSSIDDVVNAINGTTTYSYANSSSGAPSTTNSFLLSEYVTAKNINGNLVIETKDKNFDVEFSGSMKRAPDGTGTSPLTAFTPLDKNNDYSGRQGAGAEFIELVNTIDQTTTQSSLQLKLDTLGISDSAFGEFSVDSTGLITMKQDGADFAIGQVSIALFNSNRGLDPSGDNLLAKTNTSGDPIYNLNNDKTAKIEGKTLELSTADLSESLVNLMVFQRAFEANAKSITTSDELLNTLINLKR